MSYQGKFDGNAARKLHVMNTTGIKRNSKAKKQKLINKRKRLLIAATKALGMRILLALGLLLVYACVFGVVLSMMIMMVQPQNIWGYIICGVSIGYGFLVCNCRAFEYIGDKMGSKF